MSVGCEGGEINYELKVDTTKTARGLLKVQTLLYGILGILHRLGLPEPIDAAIVKIQRLISALNMLRLTLIGVEAASGPIGWAMAGIAVAGTVLTTGDLMYDMGRGY
jgi:hypothetical protein